jgi:integrase
LVPELAADLRAWIADQGKQPGDRLFTVPAQMNKILRRDLKAAGIPYRDEQGRYADFHALRHTADTMLGLAGVAPRVRQQFMRHSDIRLTLQTYDDASLYEQEVATKALGELNLR